MRTIGQRYELCAEIASGGMASVHLARQFGAGGFARIVAVKRLHERLARDPNLVAMFLDEARLVARIRHPNVVQTLDVVAEQSEATDGSGVRGELFIVMEYVHGAVLARLLTWTNPISGVPPPVAAAIMAGVLRGLHDAHEARSDTGQPLGVVHRDVSLQNILVGVDGVGRVLDFGVAKASQRITTTSADELKGKLTYMAPEQLSGGEVDRRTDIYAAAVVLWELLAGRKLWTGPHQAAIVHQIIHGPVAPPSSVQQVVAPELDRVVLRGLARAPGDRFDDALSMAIALEAAIDPAPPQEVGAWVLATCGSELTHRGRLIATIEARGSSRSLREAVDSLRMVTNPPPAPPAWSTPAGRTPSSGGLSLSSLAPVAYSPLVGQTPAPRPPPVAPSSTPFALRTTEPDAHCPPPVRARRTGALVKPATPPASLGRRRHATAIAIGSGVAALAVFALVALRAPLARRLRNHLVVEDAAASPGAAAMRPAPLLPAATPPPPAPRSCAANMVPVSGGRFFMGSDEDLPAEKPAHKVTLHAFCIDRTEVTAADYRACSDRGDCKRAGHDNKWNAISAREQKTYDPLCTGANAALALHPINCVDWSMAARFCQANGKRLPTEAEWEYAARGSDGRKYPWGDAAPSPLHLNACGGECTAWLRRHGATADGFLYAADDAWATTAPVGSFPAGSSRWGVADMVGNVWEWVSDFYGAYGADDETNPEGPAARPGAEHVIRGGAWNGAYSDWVRPTFRYQSPPETRSHGIGFRCAQTP